MAADLELAIDTHDLSGRNPLDLSLVRGIDSVAQQIKIRLLTFLGEWFLDVRAGVPYFESILVKNPDRLIVEGLFREQIEGVPEVQEIESLTLAFDSLRRELSVTFRARTTVGVLEFDQPLGVPA
jgi:hypothetical protein